MEILRDRYNIKNSTEKTQELTKLQINQNNKVITHDIGDLYTNIPE